MDALPWWTSLLKVSYAFLAILPIAYQSSIRIFLIGVLSCTTLAAMETLLKKQKPMCSSGSAWWPGGRTMAKAFLTSPRATARDASMTPPALN